MADYDLVIIGSGPAGMTAAIYAVRADLSVLMLDRLAPGGKIINTNEIQNYPGVGTVSGAELAIQMFQHTQELSVPFDYKTVKEVRVEEDGTKTVLCEEEDAVYTARAVLLCTGTNSRTLGAPGEDQYIGNGISFCAICDGAACKGKDVVVLGGGNSAVEEAIYLAGLAKSVTLAVRSYLKADPIACDKLRSFENVTVLEGWNASEFCGDGRLRSVRLKNQTTGEEKEVDCVQAFEYIGQIPATDCFRGLGVLNAAGYVEADEQMRTKVPGIYAAGDCIVKNLRQVITACADGAIAAQSAAHYIQNLK